MGSKIMFDSQEGKMKGGGGLGGSGPRKVWKMPIRPASKKGWATLIMSQGNRLKAFCFCKTVELKASLVL